MWKSGTMYLLLSVLPSLDDVLHCRTVTDTSGSSRDVKHYSNDQFESVADKSTTNDLQSSGKPKSSQHKVDETDNVRKNKDCQHSADEEAVASHTQSGVKLLNFLSVISVEHVVQ